MNGHSDFAAIACQRLVDSIIYHLENHVVQASTIVGVANIHAGPFTHGFKAFEDFDAALVVGWCMGHKILPEISPKLYHFSA